MSLLNADQLEEYKQVDGRILSLLSEAGRLTTGFFIGNVGFWAWVGARQSKLDALPPSVVLALGLLLGIVLLDIKARAIARARSYKIVFLERKSDYLWYESSLLSLRTNEAAIRSATSNRRRSYGILGIVLHAFSAVLIIADPLNGFSQLQGWARGVPAASLIPGFTYSFALVLSEDRLVKYVRQAESVHDRMMHSSDTEESVAVKQGIEASTGGGDSEKPTGQTKQA